MEPLRPGQRLLPLLLIPKAKKSNKLARAADAPGEFLDSMTITAIVRLGTATNLVASSSACRRELLVGLLPVCVNASRPE